MLSKINALNVLGLRNNFSKRNNNINSGINLKPLPYDTVSFKANPIIEKTQKEKSEEINGIVRYAKKIDKEATKKARTINKNAQRIKREADALIKDYKENRNKGQVKTMGLPYPYDEEHTVVECTLDKKGKRQFSIYPGPDKYNHGLVIYDYNKKDKRRYEFDEYWLISSCETGIVQHVEGQRETTGKFDFLGVNEPRAIRYYEDYIYRSQTDYDFKDFFVIKNHQLSAYQKRNERRFAYPPDPDKRLCYVNGKLTEYYDGYSDKRCCQNGKTYYKTKAKTKLCFYDGKPDMYYENYVSCKDITDNPLNSPLESYSRRYTFDEKTGWERCLW